MSAQESEVTAVVLKNIRDRLVRSRNSLNNCRITFARDVYWASNVVNWHLTEYRGFKRFIVSELNISTCGGYRYRLVGLLLEKYRYTDKEAAEMLNAMGWTNFHSGLSHMSRRITVKAFILKYKTTKYEGRKRDPSSDDPVFIFSLPADHAGKFSAKLCSFGMRESNGRRYGVREAMMKYVDAHM